MTANPDENHVNVLDEWRQQLQDLREQNQRLTAELAAGNIRIEETSLLHARFDCLIDSIGEAMGPNGLDFKLLAHVRWQQRLQEQLKEVQKQGTKAVLSQGSRLSASEITQLARETGTPGWNHRR
jgi:hypothetical protein